MKLIAVSDKENSLGSIEKEAQQMKSVEVKGIFYNQEDALEFVKSSPVDAAVVNVGTSHIDGLELGHKLQEFCPRIALIYGSSEKESAYDAFQVGACAFLLEPFQKEQIQEALRKAEKMMQVEQWEKRNSRIYIRTFGRFEVFVDGNPIEFVGYKAKELFALMVDRKGGIVTTEEMLTYLWEDSADDEKGKNNCRKVVQHLRETLKRYDISDIMISHRRGKSIDPKKVVCDYYEYLSGRSDTFKGEYMSNYSWAEETLAGLIGGGGTKQVNIK